MTNILKRMWSNLRGSSPLEPSTHLEQRLQLGSAEFFLPGGWRTMRNSDEVCVVRASDDLQQAIFSLIRFKSEPSFEAFNLLCDKRLSSERRVLGNGLLKSDSPSNDGQTFSMFFSGEDGEKQRLFSGYFLLAKRELFTIYLEGVSISSTEHQDSFQAFLARFKTK